MKLAHAAVVTPGRCGLYETTRELVANLRLLDVDSRIVDPTHDKNKLHPGGDEDRGAKFADMDWAAEADILVNHSGLGARLEKTSQPVIHVAHGRPRVSFQSEVKGDALIYSYQYNKNKDPRFQAVVTFWPRHKPYHEVMFPNTPVYTVPPPVDLKMWNMDGATHYNFDGKGGTHNVVCADAWRPDADLFDVINGFALFARRHKEAKLHIYGAPKDLKGWQPLLKSIRNKGNLGEVRGWVKTGLDNVYRAADMVITPHTIATRTRREAMACGCPVVSFGSSELEAFVNDMETTLSIKRESVRASAERLFNPANTAREFLAVVDGIQWMEPPKAEGVAA